MNSETTIAASNGEHFPAIQLFSFALRYFKEHALKELSAQSATIIVNEDVRWVITVPAIWRAPAKQLMRQAAYEVQEILFFLGRTRQLFRTLIPVIKYVKIRYNSLKNSLSGVDRACCSV